MTWGITFFHPNQHTRGHFSFIRSNVLSSQYWDMYNIFQNFLLSASVDICRKIVIPSTYSSQQVPSFVNHVSDFATGKVDSNFNSFCQCFKFFNILTVFSMFSKSYANTIVVCTVFGRVFLYRENYFLFLLIHLITPMSYVIYVLSDFYLKSDASKYLFPCEFPKIEPN